MVGVVLWGLAGLGLMAAGAEIVRLRRRVWVYREQAAALARQLNDQVSINRDLRGALFELDGRKRR